MPSCNQRSERRDAIFSSRRIVSGKHFGRDFLQPHTKRTSLQRRQIISCSGKKQWHSGLRLIIVIAMTEWLCDEGRFYMTQCKMG